MRRLLENVDRHIYAQGDLDGACFLYGLVNVYLTLTGREPYLNRICEAFRRVPFPEDFLSGNTGTEGGVRAEPGLLIRIIENILAAVGDEVFTVNRLAGSAWEDLAAAVTEKSVVLLHYRGDSLKLRNFDHWVVAVALAPERRALYLACSVALQKNSFNRYSTYEETFHPVLCRWSNDELSGLNPYVIPQNEAFQITLACNL